MNVICITGSKFLVKHKIYKVIDIEGDSYYLDYDQTSWNWPSGWFHKMNFEKVEDNRERKLKKILNGE